MTQIINDLFTWLITYERITGGIVMSILLIFAIADYSNKIRLSDKTKKKLQQLWGCWFIPLFVGVITIVGVLFCIGAFAYGYPMAFYPRG